MSTLQHGGGIIIHRGVRDNKDIDVYKCLSCGIKYLSKPFAGDYENDFMRITDSKQNMTAAECLKDTEIDDERRFQLFRKKGSGISWLDFGCGYGGFLSRMKDIAEDCCGVELGAKERNYLNSNEIECKKYIDEYEKEFDIISLFHVFEHLEDPRDYLYKFADHIKKGGELIIEVPNANDVLLSIYECEAFADFTYWSPHIILYTEEALKDLLEETGKFEPIELGFYQRYPLANHLMWLAKGKPGGQNKWTWLNDLILQQSYANVLAKNKVSDTILQIWRRK